MLHTEKKHNFWHKTARKVVETLLLFLWVLFTLERPLLARYFRAENVTFS